jgi:prophage regulatory protein
MPPPKAAVKGRPQGDRRARAACCQGARRLAGERKLFRVDSHSGTLDEVDHLVGLAEIAAMLGVTRQRAGQLARDYDDFPKPVAELASGRIWERAAVEAWAKKHPLRRPGRPPMGLQVPQVPLRPIKLPPSVRRPRKEGEE